MMDFNTGEILLFDKPYGWTSFDLVKAVKIITQCSKIGHAGTLDPLATGLLILCTGKKTKQIAELQDGQKKYTGEAVFGISTPSFDRETMANAMYATDHITLATIQEKAKIFEGEQMQIPPAFSALKVSGKRAFQSARKGVEVELKPRPVHIKSFVIYSYENNRAEFEVVCSKGTYIRSLIHDLGKSLQSGAYLHALQRTAIGKYQLEQAWQLPVFIQKLSSSYEIRMSTAKIAPVF